MDGRGEHGDEGSNTIDDLSGESVERRREHRTWRAERLNGEGRTRVGRRVPTGHYIPSELSMQWRVEREGRIPSEGEKDHRERSTVGQDKTWRVEDGTVGYRTEKTWPRGPNESLYSE